MDEKQPREILKNYDSIFREICKKYNVSWDAATEKEKAFVKETAWVTYELQTVKVNGTPVDQVRPVFSGSLPEEEIVGLRS